jgi:hypothetical protein
MEPPQPFNTSIEMNNEKPKKLEITDQEKERFFKSVLSDKPYEETVSLFDDKLKVTFRSLTVQENTDVVNQIIRDKESGIAVDNDTYYVTISVYRLALSMVSVDGNPFSSVTKEGFSPSFEKDTYVLARAKPILSWGTPKLSVFLDAFQTFENKAIKLASEVQNQNFWKAST